MAVVNTNANASIAQNALARNERAMNTAMERLSTGQRINSASDDAAGLAIGSRMTSQIRGLDTGIRNANDAISMVSTADGALIEVTNMLQRMRELALQASNGTTTSADRAYLSSEYAKPPQRDRPDCENTQWNGMYPQSYTTASRNSRIKWGLMVARQLQLSLDMTIQQWWLHVLTSSLPPRCRHRPAITREQVRCCPDQP